MTDEFLASENVMPSTRASWFRRFLNAIGADLSSIWNEINNNVDIGGPLVIIQHVSEASSRGYYQLVKDFPVYDALTDSQKERFDSLHAVYPLDILNLDIAHTHNALILQMIRDNSWHPDDPEKLVSGVVNTAKRIGFDASEVSIPERVIRLNQFMIDYDKHPIRLPEQKPIPGSDAMIYLIDNYLYHIQSLDSPKSVKKYTDNYIYIIESYYNDSKLNRKKKNNTIKIIKLTCASYDLWYNISNL